MTFTSNYCDNIKIPEKHYLECAQNTLLMWNIYKNAHCRASVLHSLVYSTASWFIFEVRIIDAAAFPI